MLDLSHFSLLSIQRELMEVAVHTKLPLNRNVAREKSQRLIARFTLHVASPSAPTNPHLIFNII
jgi:hypothetical protein